MGMEDRYLDGAGRTSAQNTGPHRHNSLLPRSSRPSKDFLPVVRRVADRAVTSFQATSLSPSKPGQAFPWMNGKNRNHPDSGSSMCSTEGNDGSRSKQISPSAATFLSGLLMVSSSVFVRHF